MGRTSASITVCPAARAAATRWRPSRTTNASPWRASRTGGASRPCSSHSRYSSTVDALRRETVALADPDVVERCPDRLVREHGASSPRSAIRRCGRVESNHHSQRRRGYSALSSPVLSVRTKVARVGLEPTSRAHEAREEAAPPPRDVARVPGRGCSRRAEPGSAVARRADGTVPSGPVLSTVPSGSAPSARRQERDRVWPAGVEPAISGAQNRRGGHLPYSQRTRTRPWRRPGSRRPWNRTTLHRRIRAALAQPARRRCSLRRPGKSASAEFRLREIRKAPASRAVAATTRCSLRRRQGIAPCSTDSQPAGSLQALRRRLAGRSRTSIARGRSAALIHLSYGEERSRRESNPPHPGDSRAAYPRRVREHDVVRRARSARAEDP
jgi:hypothetical protein